MSAGTNRALPALARERRRRRRPTGRVAFLRARIGDGVLALEPLPGDAGDARHRLPHLVEDRRRPDRRATAGPCCRAICWMIQRSWRASPGGSIAWRPICTSRSVLVKVPVFSGKALAGRITSARYAVSVKKMSCTTRWSSIASDSRAWFASGSDIAGFSPMMYMPRTLPALIACITSTTVRPGLLVERSAGQAPGALEARAHAGARRRAGSPGTSSG